MAKFSVLVLHEQTGTVEKYLTLTEILVLSDDESSVMYDLKRDARESRNYFVNRQIKTRPLCIAVSPHEQWMHLRDSCHFPQTFTTEEEFLEAWKVKQKEIFEREVRINSKLYINQGEDTIKVTGVTRLYKGESEDQGEHRAGLKG